MPGSQADEWYWCQDHQVAEPGDRACRVEVRLGPYVSRTDAEHWKDRAEDRNQAWDAEDDRWERGDVP